MCRLRPAVVAILSAVALLSAPEGRFLVWGDDGNVIGNESDRGLGWRQIQWAF